MRKLGSIPRLILPIVLLLTFYFTPAFALDVNEIARELACPCECPLILEDCNMSCGLDWKKQIGKKIAEGKSKEEIINDFRAKYGEASRITPMQRIHGKFYQYTRAFGAMEWVVFWSVIVLWTGAFFLGIYLLSRRFFKKKTPVQERE